MAHHINDTYVEVLPDPRRMIEGLRDTGYDFNMAIADVVDNSIAAAAKSVAIWIDMDYAGTIVVSVADNGCGMDHSGLLQAMKYGAPPRPDRRSLGKFGLGLKTASTAFCRRLSVITRPVGDVPLLKATWDLDHVTAVGKWELELCPPRAEEQEYLERIANGTSGTLVRWEQVDRLLKDYAIPGGRNAQKAIEKRIEDLRAHVAMVYQRFLDPHDAREPHHVEIWINDVEVVPWDPFCAGESELVASETIRVGPEDSDDILGEFTIRAFVLPRQEEFSSETAARRARISSASQGFYIYRENRLIHSADWLGMFQKEPHGSLLRIELSFTAELDETLQVDLKKSKIFLNESLFQYLADQFLPAPRRAADDRYRRGLRKKTVNTAVGAHGPSNLGISVREKDVDQATVAVLNPTLGDVQVTNLYGTTRLKLKVSTAARPGEFFIQAVDGIEDGLLWQPALIDSHQGVQLNTGHDFYRKVYLPNIIPSNGSTVNVQGLDSLLWALSVAELRAVSDSTRDHFSEMRFEISRILRKLVEALPEPPEPETNHER